MEWYLYSILSSLSFAGMFLCVRWLTQKGFGTKQILFFLIGFAFLGFVIFGTPFLKEEYKSTQFLIFLLVMILTGIFAVLGNFTSFEAIKRAPNPGFPVAIASGNTLLIVLLSVLFFNSPLNPLKLLGALVVIIGVTMVAIENKDSQVSKRQPSWVPLTFITLLSFTLVVLGLKKAVSLGFSSPTINLFGFAVNLIGFTILCRKELKSYFQDRDSLKFFLPVVFLAAAFSFAGNFLSILGLGLAPNPGYHEAIKNTNVLFVSLMSIPLFGAIIDKKKILGVISIVAGVVLLVM